MMQRRFQGEENIYFYVVGGDYKKISDTKRNNVTNWKQKS